MRDRRPPNARLWLFAIALSVTTACTADIGTMPDRFSDMESDVVTLAGTELSDELATSPVRVASEPFKRIGAIWDADQGDAIEVSVSAGGSSFSEWTPLTVHHVEMEGDSAFVGQYEIASGEATHYKFRGRPGAVATYARFELLLDTVSKSIEDGEDGSEGDGALTIRAETGLDLHTRSQWGARPDRCTAEMARPSRMTIHQTFGPQNTTLSPAARLRQLQSYHMDVRGWCDIGYHYLVSADGEVWEGRSAQKRGAHTANNNDGNIGIAVMGTFKSESLSTPGMRALGRVIARLGDMHSININQGVRTHAGYGSSICPGEQLDAQMNEVLDLAEAEGDDPEEPGDPEEPDPEEGEGTGDPNDAPIGLKVHGTIYQGSDTNTVLAGVTLRIGNETTTSDARGYWAFSNVPAGGFTLIASKTGYQERLIPRATTGPETWLTFGMSEVGERVGTAILHGLVYYTADTSKRVPNAIVQLSSGEKMTTDSSGYYKFIGLAAGTVTISVSANGSEPATTSVTLVAGETEWGGVRMHPNGVGGGTTTPAPSSNDNGQVCFPGANGANSTCFNLVETTPYSYPAGSGNYASPIRFLDVDASDLGTMLSPNFALSEISVRRKGKYQVVQPHAIRKLQQLRELAGHSLPINSGFRSPEYNEDIGGATKSRHIYGDAFDMNPGATGRDGLMQLCRDLGAGYVAKYANTGHIHCDWRNDPVDPGFFGIAAMMGGQDDPAWSTEDLRAEILFEDGVYRVEASGYDESEGELARDWVAYDAFGTVIAEVEAMEFVAPEGAHNIQVTVGGMMEVERLADEQNDFYE